jgi:hypothetical protein
VDPVYLDVTLYHCYEFMRNYTQGRFPQSLTRTLVFGQRRRWPIEPQCVCGLSRLFIQ